MASSEALKKAPTFWVWSVTAALTGNHLRLSRSSVSFAEIGEGRSADGPPFFVPRPQTANLPEAFPHPAGARCTLSWGSNLCPVTLGRDRPWAEALQQPAV